MNLKELQNTMLQMTTQERLRLAYWLLSTVVETPTTNGGKSSKDNPLLAVAGRFSGGPGNTAERAEEILEQEVRVGSGLSQA